MEIERSLFLLQFAATWYLVGLIWMVQIVHYPLMSRVGTDDYREYQIRHQTWTSWVVGPPMLLEAATSAAAIWYPWGSVNPLTYFAGFLLVLGIWLSTAVVQIPCHERLAQGFDASVHRRLVRSNWIRTWAWSLRGLILAYILWQGG